MTVDRANEAVLLATRVVNAVATALAGPLTLRWYARSASALAALRVQW